MGFMTFVIFATVVAVVFLAPDFLFFHFGALDSPFAHLFVVFNFCVGEFAVFSENYIEAQKEYAQPVPQKCLIILYLTTTHT